MKNYVAYNSVEKWGDYEPDKNLNFYSGKSEKYLRNSIGCNVWVIIGTRIGSRMTYQLAGKYSPTKILSEKNGGFRLVGLGKPISPQIELTNLQWFSRLLREQRNFSRGLNEIRDKIVLANLQKLLPEKNKGAKWDKISVADYVKALKSLPEKYREILVLQFQCPRHEVSAGQLARLMGYSTFPKANLSYGRAAHLVCDTLNVAKPSFGQWFAALSEAHHNGKSWIWIMRPNLVAAIKRLGWSSEYQTLVINPEEVAAANDLVEGKVQLVAVNVFERNAKARAACLQHYGFICSVCDFNFEKFYGEIGREFVHVHHLKPLSEIGEEYKIDPIKDLLPVCPNCHAMLHRKTPTLTIAELKNLINSLRLRVSAIKINP
jgi:putative restriction endonuclease